MDKKNISEKKLNIRKTNYVAIIGILLIIIIIGTIAAFALIKSPLPKHVPETSTNEPITYNEPSGAYKGPSYVENSKYSSSDEYYQTYENALDAFSQGEYSKGVNLLMNVPSSYRYTKQIIESYNEISSLPFLFKESKLASGATTEATYRFDFGLNKFIIVIKETTCTPGKVKPSYRKYYSLSAPFLDDTYVVATYEDDDVKIWWSADTLGTLEKHETIKDRKEKKQDSSSSTNKKTYVPSPYSSYDKGYNDVMYDDDYDWDRYQRDRDYADGVDDAMDDIDW